MAADFEPCLAFTLREEGLWSDNPHDPGGSTMRGLTLGLFTAWRKARDEPPPTKDDLRNIGTPELTAIYGGEFWNPLHCQALPRGIDLMMFDFGVNANPKRAALMLQRALGFAAKDVDGWIGPKTLESAVKADPLTLLSVIAFHQQSFYFASPNYPNFGAGWLARTNRRLLASWDMVKASVSAPAAQGVTA